MSKLVWDKTKDRHYETGIDRGVLYLASGSYVWNGLISVTHSAEGANRTPLYLDGVKYFDYVQRSDFRGTIKALGYPSEFGPCIGNRSVLPGFLLTNQPRESFGLSYRTKVDENDYKLHLVYSALATPTHIGYNTISNVVKPTPFEWRIDPVPLEVTGKKPSAHYILDSRIVNKDFMSYVENYLYGSDTNDPYLPTIDQIITVLTDLITEPLSEPI